MNKIAKIIDERVKLSGHVYPNIPNWFREIIRNIDGDVFENVNLVDMDDINFEKYALFEKRLSGIENILIKLNHRLDFISSGKTMDKPRDRMTIDETLSFLAENGIPFKKGQLYKCSMEHSIPVTRFGKRLVFSRVALNEWIKNNTK